MFISLHFWYFLKVGNVFIALLLIFLVAMTRRNVPNVSLKKKKFKVQVLLNVFSAISQIYTRYSMMTGLLVNIGIGFLIVLILAVILITIMFWFDKDSFENPVQMSTGVTTTRVEEELKSDFSFDLDLATALKFLITIEGLLYVVINVRMLKRWVSFVFLYS